MLRFTTHASCAVALCDACRAYAYSFLNGASSSNFPLTLKEKRNTQESKAYFKNIPHNIFVALRIMKQFHQSMGNACEATEEVLQAIPHRPPFLFVDRILRLTDVEIVAERTLRKDEPFFKGHYPQQALMPGVLMCEAVFQTAGIWMSRTILQGDWMQQYMPVLIRIESAKFKQMAFPGDCLQLEARFVQKMKDFYWFKGSVKKQDHLLVSLEFVLGVVPRSDA